jgi:hypothetical protein
MDTQVVISTVLVVLVSVTNFLLVWWFWRRRDHQPIKYRWPQLTVIQQVVFWSLHLTFFIGIVGYAVQRKEIVVCGISAVVGIFILPAFLATIIVRMLILFLASKMVVDSEKLEKHLGFSRKNTGDALKSGVQWYWKYRKYLNRYHYVRASSLIFVCLSFPFLIAFAATGPARWKENCEAFGISFISLVVIETTIAMVLTFALLPSISKVKDNLGLRWEARGSLVTPPSYVIGILLYMGTGSSATIVLTLFLVIFPIVIAIALSIVLPLRESLRIEYLIKKQKETEKQKRASEVELSESDDRNSKELLKFLAVPEGLEVLESFARAEFSVENILFYKAVCKFKKCFRNYDEIKESKEECDAGAWKMYENICHQYIEADSPLSINLRDDVRKNALAPLLAAIENKGGNQVSSKMLDRALDYVLQVFYFDTFSRFKLTEQFQQMSASMEKMSSLDEVSVMLGITSQVSAVNTTATTF